ncbi:hypothetical protein B0H16DRAFT_1463492 [Mycena metata]|uniref:Uncharacterized protein n=1 Tax=Mycena metata TaxID=1033252 RepID=A0AAD7N3E5_9AGAR|nr:hypothetical protein B0H16DRAFT_1463492 [Mycena metata]
MFGNFNMFVSFRRRRESAVAEPRRRNPGGRGTASWRQFKNINAAPRPQISRSSLAPYRVSTLWRHVQSVLIRKTDGTQVSLNDVAVLVDCTDPTQSGIKRLSPCDLPSNFIAVGHAILQLHPLSWGFAKAMINVDTLLRSLKTTSLPRDFSVRKNAAYTGGLW